jgi:LuxR family transcriptional regulator, maltose regulon positive regulatory protein
MTVPDRKEGGPMPAEDRAPLTERELEVGRLIAEGCSTRQAAAELFISPKTVEFHLGRVYRKLAVSNRAQLTRAMMAAAVPPP